MTLPYPGSAPNWGTVSSSDGVVTAVLDPAHAGQRISVDFTVAGSPIHLTAASSVNAVTVTEQSTGNVVRSLASQAAPGGSVIGYDHEAPFNTALSYVAQAFDGHGNLLATSTAAVTNVPGPVDGFATWFKSLLTPSLSVIVETATVPAWDADIAQGVIYPIALPGEDVIYPIVVSDARQAEQATIEVLTRNPAARDALKTLLRSPGPYLLQQPGFDTDDRYVTIGKASRKRPVNVAWEPFRSFTLPLVEVARPDPYGWKVAIPGHTYADSTARWGTYAARTGTYAQRITT